MSKAKLLYMDFCIGFSLRSYITPKNSLGAEFLRLHEDAFTYKRRKESPEA